MKAVVMAGGEGTRLRPLTVNRPKPMVPVVGRPVMEHIVGLVRRHGIDEIVATLHYLPDVIQDYFGDGSEFGVKMKYTVEVTPLGTAGSVRMSAHDLTETFIVISGDALTDMDLTDLIRFHKEKGAVATLALTRVPNPLEFGVVITDGAGRIVRFLEKPSWSEVFSDTINTGIYVLEPEVFELMEADKVYDFSKDIFPKLLAAGKPMYGYVSRNYWCDIGSLDQCLQANEDCLAGRVQVNIPGEEVRRGIWLGRNVDIDPSAEITPPVVICDGAVVRRGARIGEYSVIGPNTVVDRDAEVKRSATMGSVYLGRGSDVRACTIARGASVGQRASIGQGVVIGDETQIGGGAIIKPGVKIWPNKNIESGAQVNTSVVWGSRHAKAVFGPEGVSGLGNIEVTPELAVRLGEGFGSTLPKGDIVCVSRDGSPAAVMLKRAVMSGLASAGVRVYNLESSSLPLTRHAIPTLGAKGGLYVMANPSAPGGVTLKLLDARGMDVDTATERKIETMMVREDTRKVPVEEIGQVSYPSKILDFYRTDFFSRIDLATIRKRQFKVVMDFGHGAAGQLMPAILGALGCQDMAANTSPDPLRLSRTPEQLREATEHVAGMVRAIKADLGVIFDATGERIRLVDNKGRALTGQQALALFVALAVEGKPAVKIAVPVTATAAIERVAGSAERVERTKTGARALMQAAARKQFSFCGDEHGGYIFPDFSLGQDGLFATVQLLHLLALSARPLDALVDALPEAEVAEEEMVCPLEAKGAVMRHLIEATADKQPVLVDGVKVSREGQWVALIPDPVQPVMHIYSEPAAKAGDLVSEYRNVVQVAIKVSATEQEAAAAKEE
ncbi:MAG TPA: sugar phosphate nucleotidyltransferase [Symbiobacteriaceae bacterium]|nr:sugar phosphate nucleotidyltransferase [Symbiobacteriaceae bacterium]